VTPTVALLYYTGDHTTLGDWDQDWNPGAGEYYNGNTSIKDVIFPAGSSTVLFVGTQGTGPFCYGEGTDNPALDGQPAGDGVIYCYDPDDSSKGTHGYPYVAEVWAFDAHDLAAVAAGTKEPWDVTPYEVWTLPLPYDSGRIGGAAYDASNGLLYVSQQHANDEDPVVEVFKIT
jgi:hypothetical protein